MLAVPVSLALGARVSGWLLQQTLARAGGWQWVFLGEGLPAVLLGVALPWLMTDRPSQARWLGPRSGMAGADAGGRARRGAGQRGGAGPDRCGRPAVWLLALGIFAANIGGYAAAFWLPTVVEDLLLATTRRRGRR